MGSDLVIGDYRIKEFNYFSYALFTYYVFYKIIDKIMINNINYLSLSYDRKNYFLKNIVKSFMLIIIAYYSTIEISKGIFNLEYNNIFIYRLAFSYSALDVLGLLMVNNLPINSKVHHIVSFSLSIFNTLIDYNQSYYWLGLPIYCILSSYAFSVNLYLALRLILKNNNLKYLITYSLYSYSFLFLLNWIIQLNFILINIYSNNNISYDFIFYIILIIFLAIDDIELIKFLNYQLKKIVKDK